MSDTQPKEFPPPTESSKPTGRILQLFAQNPVVGLVGCAVGVLSLATTIFFGVTALKTKELSLYVNPKTTIVRSGHGSDLHVLYRGQEVSTDVTALQVELWNAGREPIRPEHLLSPIILETTPNVPILEARIRHISRPITQIVLDTTHIADGKAAVSWKILEQNDAAVIQFILAGPPATSITVTGSLEGQPRVTVFRASATGLFWVVIGVSLCIMMLMLLYAKWLDKHHVPFPTSVLLQLIIGYGPPLLLWVLLVTVVHYYLGAPSVPLPFD